MMFITWKILLIKLKELYVVQKSLNEAKRALVCSKSFRRDKTKIYSAFVKSFDVNARIVIISSFPSEKKRRK